MEEADEVSRVDVPFSLPQVDVCGVGQVGVVVEGVSAQNVVFSNPCKPKADKNSQNLVLET